MTIPPVKIRMKPVLFILKRKRDYEEMLYMRNFYESDEENQEQHRTSADNEIINTSTDNESQLEETEENYTESFPEKEAIKNVPQVFSEEIMSKETKVEEFNIPKQVLEYTLSEKLISPDSSEDDIDVNILGPQFKNKKKIEEDSVKITQTIDENSEKPKNRKKIDTDIPSLQDIDNIAAVKIEELKFKRSNIVAKKKNYQAAIPRKENINKHIEKKIVHVKENEIVREISEDTDLEYQKNETDTVGEKEIIDLEKNPSSEEKEVDQNKIDKIIEELKINTFSKHIDKPRKAIKSANSEKKDSNPAINIDMTLKSKLKMEALELAAKRKIYEQKSDENKQQVKRNLKKLIQKYRRKKSDDINTKLEEKHDESFDGVMQDENNKQRDEITKINSQIMEIIENNPNIANKDLIKEKLQTTIINELIKVIDDKIVEKTGKQISAKDNIKTRKLVEAIELKKIKDTKPSNIVQSDEILEYDDNVENPSEALETVKEVTVMKFDREEKIKEAQAKIEDIMNIIDEIVETIEIHNIK
ncbi:hypothetical protein WA026_013466 [Henosepilachna vigintioctopunctata]|uniref:Uncharacterized protein n=1 Tax=Henosepilachna vigintioctopunctata TaxID=420089 RepID=A0AAW1VBZ7_9CUCU